MYLSVCVYMVEGKFAAVYQGRLDSSVDCVYNVAVKVFQYKATIQVQFSAYYFSSVPMTVVIVAVIVVDDDVVVCIRIIVAQVVTLFTVRIGRFVW